MTCPHGVLGVPEDVNEFIEVAHVDVTQPSQHQPPSYNRYVERVRYKDWIWRCRKCCPEAVRDRNQGG